MPFRGFLGENKKEVKCNQQWRLQSQGDSSNNTGYLCATV